MWLSIKKKKIKKKLRTEFTSPIAKSTSPGYQTLLSLHAGVLVSQTQEYGRRILTPESSEKNSERTHNPPNSSSDALT